MSKIYTSLPFALAGLFLLLGNQAWASFSTSYSGDISLTLVETHLSCHSSEDGILSVIPTGGTSPYFYEWSDSSQLQTNANLQAGFHAVTVTDVNGCTAIASAILTQPDTFLVSLQAVDGFCGAIASVGATPVGGTPPYNYLWSNGWEENFQENIEAGTYSVTITDLNACTITASITVQQDESNLVFELDIMPPTCFGDSDGILDLSIFEGAPPFTYYINGELSDGDFSNLAAGTYVLFVSDTNGCSDGTTVFLSEPSPIELNITSNDTEVEVVPFNGIPPYTFQWSTGDTLGQVTNLVADTYTVTVTDQNGCSTSQSIDVLEPLGANTIPSLQELSVYPNPCINDCFLKANFIQKEYIKVNLLDSKGKPIQTTTFQQKSIAYRFDVQNLDSGIYFIQLVVGNAVRVEKVLVL